jgi:hypothetical protein
MHNVICELLELPGRKGPNKYYDLYTNICRICSQYRISDIFLKECCGSLTHNVITYHWFSYIYWAASKTSAFQSFLIISILKIIYSDIKY